MLMPPLELETHFENPTKGVHAALSRPLVGRRRDAKNK